MFLVLYSRAPFYAERSTLVPYDFGIFFRVTSDQGNPSPIFCN